MHKFYVSNARFSFKDSSNKDSNVECTGNVKIQDGLKSIGVASVSVSDIVTSSLQCGEESGPKEIMVMVSGSIHLKEQDAPKLFAQSFFISEAMEGVMFIVAESLHILSAIAQIEEKDESLNELPSQPEKVEAIKEAPVERSEPVAQPVVVATAATTTVPEQSTPQETPAAVVESTPRQSQPSEKAKPKQQAQQQQSQQQSQAPKEKTPAQAWGPNSKNAKIMSSIAPPAKSEEKTASSTATQSEGSSTAATTATTKQQQSSSSAAASSSSGNHGQRLSKEQVERSVYIKDLPNGTTKDEIQEAFSKFGKISLVDLRQEKRCVYVEYVDPASAKAALVKPATPIMLAGKPIEVKERLMVQQQGEGNNSNSNSNNKDSSRGAKSAAKPKSSGAATTTPSNGNSKSAPKQPAKPKENGATKSEESKPAASTNGSDDKQKSTASKGNSASSDSKPKQQQQPKQNQNQNQPKPAGKPKST